MSGGGRPTPQLAGDSLFFCPTTFGVVKTGSGCRRGLERRGCVLASGDHQIEVIHSRNSFPQNPFRLFSCASLQDPRAFPLSFVGRRCVGRGHRPASRPVTRRPPYPPRPPVPRCLLHRLLGNVGQPFSSGWVGEWVGWWVDWRVSGGRGEVGGGWVRRWKAG